MFDRILPLLTLLVLLVASGPVQAAELSGAPVTLAEVGVESVEDSLGSDASAKACCKICRKGKACGDSCIKRSYTCRQPPGCACDAGAWNLEDLLDRLARPPTTPVTPTLVPVPAQSLSRAR